MDGLKRGVWRIQGETIWEKRRMIGGRTVSQALPALPFIWYYHSSSTTSELNSIIQYIQYLCQYMDFKEAKLAISGYILS